MMMLLQYLCNKSCHINEVFASGFTFYSKKTDLFVLFWVYDQKAEKFQLMFLCLYVIKIISFIIVIVERGWSSVFVQYDWGLVLAYISHFEVGLISFFIKL